ncbi:hypothetical protein D2E73_08565 [Mycobacteroides abscessus]|uniref:hypothetical protein n=1 Tax=Mycobacteroides abscessus TaxID=36809 RepID=UPI000C2608E1|nr:hypothetical protein [Mycobacteroides abscessus]RIT31403.1 hypothetical protein D2E73_08565 [Mycobacteroides abscessus]RIT32423.1 hypothetical protein D2E99_18365 [Mycobacteroides abscessus]
MRSANRRQDAGFMLLDDDLMLCELTWYYDQSTESAVRHIWVSAPLDEGYVWLKSANSNTRSWPSITAAP